MYGALITILNTYDHRYAFAANNVHEKKVAAVRKEIEAELAAKFRALEEERKRLDEIAANNLVQTRLNEAQAEMLSAERAQFEAELARDKEHRKTTDELETSKRQIELIKRQLAKRAAHVIDKEKELNETRKSLDRLQAKIADQALLAGLDIDGLSSDESSD
jgi:hypothetical protein